MRDEDVFKVDEPPAQEVDADEEAAEAAKLLGPAAIRPAAPVAARAGGAGAAGDVDPRDIARQEARTSAEFGQLLIARLGPREAAAVRAVLADALCAFVGRERK
jgi:hypothetical protein